MTDYAFFELPKDWTTEQIYDFSRKLKLQVTDRWAISWKMPFFYLGKHILKFWRFQFMFTWISGYKTIAVAWLPKTPAYGQPIMKMWTLHIQQPKERK